MNVSEEDMTPVAPQKQNQELQRFVLQKAVMLAHNQTYVANATKKHWQKLTNTLMRAILAGYPQVTIVHGKGTGALRTGITEFLKITAV